MVRSADIRNEFLNFFTSRGHRLVPSSSIVPANDPTLLFTSAGMVQFKALYAATGKLEYTRATSVQKCFRVTDLEQVGRTPRHCTFFEMLGNFSFGDYFKREAITWAWEFCTVVLKMPADKLWPSVYTDDDEAADIWEKEIGVPASRIVRLGRKDNFWGPAGSTGACGPCSEIYFDLGPEFGPETSRPGDDHDRYQEFWNLVFPQFFQDETGHQGPLANRGIDTGMGLERLVQILNGQSSVFETDAFRPIIEAAADMAGKDPDSSEAKIALRIVAEHARALTIAVSDGVYPGNEGRGYVVRRLLRRAARQGQILGLTEPFLYRLSGLVVDLLGDHYTELREARGRVASILRAEEERFQATLSQGMHRFDEIAERLKAAGETRIAGSDLFLLYDTFGFPVDLTRDMAAEKGLAVDEPGFESEMARQVERSRSASKFDNTPGEREAPWQYLEEGGGEKKHSEFIGYEETEAPVTMIAFRAAGPDIEFLLDRTPFYAESGGQVSDTGTLTWKDLRIDVKHVRKNDRGEIVHRGTIGEVGGEGTLSADVPKTGDAPPPGNRNRAPVAGPWTASIPLEVRRSTERNHTATHLLHAALRTVLGTHVAQAGSLVAPDRLRFDFQHFAPITEGQKEEIERIVNREILADTAVDTQWDSLDEARKKGSMALFGEKYGDWVRQVIVGAFSRELCGGCHVRRTGEIGAFRLLVDESVSAGTRRIEAATGWRSVRLLREDEEILARLSETLKTTRGELEEKLRAVVAENDELRRERDRLKSAAVMESAGDLESRIVEIRGVRFVAAEIPADSMNHLREAADRLRPLLKSGAAVLGAKFDGKAAFVAVVTDDLAGSKLRADQLVRDVARIAGGSGGGKPNLATAGAKEPEKLTEALAAAKSLLEKQIES